MNNVIKYKLHSESDFEYLFKSLYSQVCLYGQGFVKDADVVEDIVSEVFYKIWERRESLDENQSIKSYIYRSVYNRCLNYIRDNSNKIENNLEISELTDESIYDQIEQTETEMRILSVIEQLPEKCREVFELSRFDGDSHKVIATKLGISTKTIENHITKALKILKEQLRDILPVFFIIISILYYYKNK